MYSISQENSESVDLFKTSEIANVIKKDTLNIDKSRDLLIIPVGKMFRKYFEKINYFKEVITYDVFEKEIKNANISEEKYKDSKNIADAYKVVYNNHRKFLTFKMFIDNDKNTLKFVLNRPDLGDIFIVEGKSKTNLIGISAGQNYIPENVYDAMMNELVNYIKTNSKTFLK